jgi:capsular exopolysaccharide synthesis family protein
VNSIQNRLNNVTENKTQNNSASLDEIKIVYTQTRQQQLDLTKLRQRRVVALQQRDLEADIFRLLRTKVLKQLRANNWNSFGITAPTQGAGKTMVAVNLAIAMAMNVNQTVLLVDMDLRYPKVDWYFDLNVKYSLRDYLVADVPLTEILINPGIERLVILPGKGQEESSSEMLSSPKMRALVTEIKNRYPSRIIIFDLPPVLAADDVAASIDYYDATLLVIEDGGNKPDEIQKSLQLLSGSALLGTVLNKSENLPSYQRYY